VVDGEQVVVPAVGAGPSVQAGGDGHGAVANGNAPSAQQTVDLNDADAAALDALPGIGLVLASRIIEWRAAHGRFAEVDQLGEVDGIGPTLLSKLRPLVTV
jgi:competence protein ComEA